MPNPHPVPIHKQVPEVDELIRRLHAVEAETALLETKFAQEPREEERAGIRAHLAALGRRKAWYLARIRAVKPVETLGRSVADDIHAAEAL